MLLEKRIPIKYIFNKVKIDLMIVAFFAIIIYFLTNNFDPYFPEIPISIPAFLGTAISILLSFKLSQSYERWWEARKIWGSIVNDSRSFVIQLKTFLPDADKKDIQIMAYRQIAWCYALTNSLRGIDTKDEIKAFLNDSDLNDLDNHKNKSLALTNLNAKHLATLKKDGKIDTFYHVQLDKTLVRLCDSMGRAERIKSTVFPVTYRKFLHFIIYLFIILLSISLTDVMSYYEIPLLLILSLPFFLLEKSARHMQDPFENKPSDTAMSTISRNIEINIKQLLDETEIPLPYPAERFYVM